MLKMVENAADTVATINTLGGKFVPLPDGDDVSEDLKTLATSDMDT